jgi:hypothetical protein
MLLLSLCSIPFFVVRMYINKSEEPYDNAEGRMNDQYFQLLLDITLVTGLVLAGYFFINLLVRIFNGTGSFWFTPSNTQGEARLKKAATRKMNTALLNAHELHSRIDEQSSRSSTLSRRGVSSSMSSSSASDQTMLNFVLKGQKMESAGGFIWTWRLLLSGALFDTEGIWLPTRLFVFQGAQTLTAGVGGFLFVLGTRAAAKAAEDAQAELLTDDTPDWARQ